MTVREIATVVILFLTGLVGAFALADEARPEELTADALKRAYLECERRALLGHLSTGEIAGCSTIYEELKQRVFNGDWTKVRQWLEDNLNSQQAV